MSPDEPALDPDDVALARWIRATRPPEDDAAPGVPPDLLRAYVLGTASAAERTQVRLALARSARLRRELLELSASLASVAGPDAQGEFDRAQPPPIESMAAWRALADADAAAVPPSRTGAAGVSRAMRPRARRIVPWMTWAAGGWAALATAACVMLVVGPLQRGAPARLPSAPGPLPVAPAPAPSPGTAPAGPPSPAPSPPTAAPLTLELAPPAIRAELHSMRGENGPTRIAVAAGTRALELRLEPPDVPDDAVVRVTLARLDGTRLLESRHPVREFFGGRRLVLRSARPFAPARYRLTIAGVGALSDESVSYEFELVRAGS